MPKLTNKPFQHALDHLQKSFDLNAQHTKYFRELEKMDITSCCHTLDGGFDPESGIHHPEEREINYKLRVTCRQEDNCDDETVLYLVPIKGTIDTTI